MNDYFISFGNTKRNLGVVITSAPDETRALERVTQLGLNPGGEAAIWKCSSKEADKLGRDRLIPTAELKAQGYRSSSNSTPVERVGFLQGSVRVCQDCNNKLRA